MSYTRTALLLAGLTGLFLAAGYLLGGEAGSGGVEICGQPLWLAAALAKLENAASRRPPEPRCWRR